ncbi:MAG: MerR family transcriptional regulator [Defluviitaleaceae bacterium]|nr:MerR family transcriptional regulator [Defluviitaleaceae bacterium]
MNEYSVNKLSKISGVSGRTLRYYDKIGLLKPAEVAFSGYRYYGQEQVDNLQQILLYKEMGFSLDDIKKLIISPDFNRELAFEKHLAQLHKKRKRLDDLIVNVTKSIATMKGETEMTDKEKFEGFKQQLIYENEQNYGAEVRQKWGDVAMEASNAHLKGMSGEQYEKSEELRKKAEQTLLEAFKEGNPASQLAQKACDLHRQWLCMFYPAYSKEYHIGLGEMYVSDPRFKAYYNKIAEGIAEFLRDAINIYCN